MVKQATNPAKSEKARRKQAVVLNQPPQKAISTDPRAVAASNANRPDAQRYTDQRAAANRVATSVANRAPKSSGRSAILGGTASGFMRALRDPATMRTGSASGPPDTPFGFGVNLPARMKGEGAAGSTRPPTAPFGLRIPWATPPAGPPADTSGPPATPFGLRFPSGMARPGTDTRPPATPLGFRSENAGRLLQGIESGMNTANQAGNIAGAAARAAAPGLAHQAMGAVMQAGDITGVAGRAAAPGLAHRAMGAAGNMGLPGYSGAGELFSNQQPQPAQPQAAQPQQPPVGPQLMEGLRGMGSQVASGLGSRLSQLQTAADNEAGIASINGIRQQIEAMGGAPERPDTAGAVRDIVTAPNDPEQLMAGLQLNPYNQGVRNAPGLVRGEGRAGVTTMPTNAPGLNDASDARIAAEQARQARVADNVAALRAQNEDPNSEMMQRKRYMFGTRPLEESEQGGAPSRLPEMVGEANVARLGFTGGRHYVSDPDSPDQGQQKFMSDTRYNMQNMPEERRQLFQAAIDRRRARQDALPGLKADRRQQQQLAMQQQADQQRENATLQALSRNPQALASYMSQRGQNQIAQQGLQQRLSAADAERRSQADITRFDQEMRQKEFDLKKDQFSPEAETERARREAGANYIANDPRLGRQAAEQMLGGDGVMPNQEPIGAPQGWLTKEGELDTTASLDRAEYLYDQGMKAGKDQEEIAAEIAAEIDENLTPAQQSELAESSGPAMVPINGPMIWEYLKGSALKGSVGGGFASPGFKKEFSKLSKKRGRESSLKSILERNAARYGY